MISKRIEAEQLFQLSSTSKAFALCLSLTLSTGSLFAQTTTITHKNLPISQTSLKLAQKQIKTKPQKVVMKLHTDGAQTTAPAANSDKTATEGNTVEPAGQNPAAAELRPEISAEVKAATITEAASNTETAAIVPTNLEVLQNEASAEVSNAQPVLDANADNASPESPSEAGPISEGQEVDKADVAMLAAPVPVAPGKPVSGGMTDMTVTSGGPIVIDNDEIAEIEETIKYEDLPTDEGKTKVKTGAKFPVVSNCEITSKTAKKGDNINGYLKYDLKIGDRLVAKKGSAVRGHINYALKARTTLHSLWSPERWYKNSGCLGIEFDEIINEKGEHLPLVAKPARQARIVKNKGEGRVLGVNHNGQITGPWAQQLRYKAVRVGLNAALTPAGVFSFGAMPVALGLMGAVNPSFAFAKPVGLNVRHRRIKGFAWGFLSGIPGSWLIEDTTVKGQEAVIKPGDEFLAEFKEEFTGEPATDAQLLPGASTKVRGQIVNPQKK